MPRQHKINTAGRSFANLISKDAADCFFNVKVQNAGEDLIVKIDKTNSDKKHDQNIESKRFKGHSNQKTSKKRIFNVKILDLERKLSQKL
jgi:hypothetical protein